MTSSTTSSVAPPWGPPREIPRWMPPLAAALGGSLDRRLAQGHSPESSRLMAARAAHLVAMGVRRELAEQWHRLLQLARSPRPSRRAVRLCRARILAAEPFVHDLIEALAAPLPVPACGVALASCLLSDGTGPLYNWQAPVDLIDTLRQAVAYLDPTVPLDEPVRSSS